MKFLAGLLSFFMPICFIIMIVTMLIVANNHCDHNETQTKYIFVEDNSTASNSVADFCKECGERVTTYSIFKGELVDQSYLGAIVEHSDGSEILKGEYYTVTAVAPLGYYGYSDKRVELTCEVENNEYIVRFTAEFQDVFRAAVSSVEEGEEITFRGRFYDEGCGFTDCELITK